LFGRFARRAVALALAVPQRWLARDSMIKPRPGMPGLIQWAI
jgi:hypothetical protein